MAPNLLGGIARLDDTSNSPDPLEIIGKPVVYHSKAHVEVPRKKKQQNEYEWQIVWRNVIAFIYLHVFAIYGLYLMFTSCQWRTNVFTLVTVFLGGQGITSGAHRLWAHRTYKAKLPLRIFLCIFQTFSFQNHIYEWVRDHRVHHKFTDTDADPHNASRGFFFSHIGWLMVKKHKDVFTKGKTVDLSDLEEDSVVMFQKKYYLILMPLLCFVIPTVIPWYFWNESWWNCWYSVIFRYTATLNGTWSVNSAAHIWGTKPYDKKILPTENKSVAFFAFGEGWHNYHHVFPWDYKAAELGNYKLNLSTGFIDLMHKIGWAYDLKTASVDMVRKRMKRTGDGSIKVPEDDNNNHHHHHHDHDHLWGWGDKDMSKEDVEDVVTYNKLEEKAL